jgi:hypothetical protein
MGKSLTGSRRRGKQLAKPCVEFAIRASKARESVATSDRLLAISSVDEKTGCDRKESLEPDDLGAAATVYPLKYNKNCFGGYGKK